MPDPIIGHHQVADTNAVRILRPLNVQPGPVEGATFEGAHTGIVVDVETTGLNPKEDKLIELALRRFRYTSEGAITHLGQSYSWLEDPGFALTPEIRNLTRLTDADLVGQRIDDQLASMLLNSANLVIAHNARFDRQWVEQRLPGVSGKEWACSMAQVDWPALGFDGCKLGHLLMQMGNYHSGHRAAADVDATIRILMYRSEDGTTALARLLEASDRPSWIVQAHGTPFSAKDLLRGRKYQWDVKLKLWWREVTDAERMEEEWWLASHVYASSDSWNPFGPKFIEVTAATRFLPQKQG